ncbi:MAG: hypothetical protein IKK12_00630 [Clostridia bacterium]|nr:hypothetical protein [Clostridia bacterium]
MDVLYKTAMSIVVLFSAACMLKLMLPGGAMKRSAAKAVDIVTLLYLIRIISGVLPNG